MIEYSKKLIFNLSLYLSAVLITVLPALHSGMCYRHCTAPKDFTVFLGAAAAGVACALYILLAMFAGEKLSVKVPRAALLYPAFAVSCFASLAVAPSFVSGVERCMELSVYAVWFAFFMWLTRGEREREVFLGSALLSGLVPAVLMVMEAFGKRAVVLWENIESSGLTARETFVSTFGNPDFAAPFFGLLALINIRFMIYSSSRIMKALLAVNQVLLLSAWLLPMCRSSQIALLVSFSLYFFLARRMNSEKTYGFVNALIVILIVFFAVQLKDMLSGSTETVFSRIAELFSSRETAGTRLFMLAIGWKMIVSSPLVGTGAGCLLLNFPIFSSSFDQSAPFWNVVPYFFNTGHLHNEFVNIASEAGLAPFALFLAFVSLAVYGGVSACAARDGSRKKEEKFEMTAILTCSVLFILVDSMFNVTMSLSHVNILFVLFAASLFNSLPWEGHKSATVALNSAPKRLAVIALMVLFGILASVAALRTVRADWYLMQGRIFEQVGREPDALNCYLASGELRANRAEPLHFASAVCEGAGEVERAVYLARAASNVNLSLPIVYSLARLAIRHLDLNSEFRYLNFLTRAYPRFDESHYLLGLRYMKERKTNAAAFDLARASLERALALNPKHIPARMALAELYFERRDYPKARVELDEALRTDPKLKNAIYLKNRIPGFFF